MGDIFENKLFITGIIIFLSVAFSAVRDWIKKNKEDIGVANELGVPLHYEVDWKDLDFRTDKYESFREQAAKKFASNEDTTDAWMSSLPEEPKEMMKFMLMARIVTTLHIYEQVEKDYKGNWGLYQSSVISKTYWNSLENTLEGIKKELDMLKDDMMMLEPKCRPADVFGEAWRLLERFGPTWPENAQQSCPADCKCEKSQKEREAKTAKRCPPGCQCPTSQKLRAEGKLKDEDITQILGPFGSLYEEGVMWRQTPPPNEEVEIAIRMPTETTSSQVEVKFTSDMIQVHKEQELYFERELLEKIKPDECTWVLAQEPLGPGDEVILSGLSNDDYNGLEGTIQQTGTELREKNRWKICLTKDKKELSIAEDKLIVQNEKGRLTLSVEKVVSKPWPNPPWKTYDGEDL